MLQEARRQVLPLLNRQQAEQQQQRAAAAAIMPVNYDQQNLEDDDGAIQNSRDVKLPFNKHDIKLWFSLVESKMQFAGIKKQWSKRQILIQLIPPEFHSDFRQYLQLQETEAGADSYFRLKTAIIKQFGPKQASNFDKAIARVMTGTPSQLGRQILHDICPAASPLQNCHCANVVLGIWRRSLPQVVRNQIADMDFTAATFNAVFDKADSVWEANSASSTVVAALEKTKDQQQVAAVTSNRGGGNRGNRGGSGSGRGGRGGGRGRGRGPRHADQPPFKSCDLHWRFGKGAWNCGDRHKCPWRDFESPKPSHNRNIVAGAEIVE